MRRNLLASGSRFTSGAVNGGGMALRAGSSRLLHKTIDNLLLAGLVEHDGKLVAVDLYHLAVAEFQVEPGVVRIEFRGGRGGLRDQLAFDGHRAALVAGEACVAARA